ncbi:ABC transporter ATP-binding protein [Virgibacillus sp. C22-A2]|uniref:ABC transporter ATP-binding protein n=1 Tax=Virgibacillus tibetensis TaxID=3042313 RepID=A0ABU6KKT4_9BACI|nr:ABC transporter ATP-binding protein [Virgibacillus sp. C22-A2]
MRLFRKKQKHKYWKEYKWIISFLLPYKKHLFYLVICGLFLTLGEIVIPKSFQILIDDFIPNNDISGLYQLIVVVSVVIIFMILAAAVMNLQKRIIREKAARDLQYASFDKLRGLGFSYIEKNPTGEILSLLNTDVNDIQRIYRDYLPNIILYSIMIVGLSIMLLTLNFWLTLIIIPSYFLYYTIGPWVERQAFLYLKRYNEDRVDLEKQVYETMSSMQELRAYGAIDWRMSHFIERYKPFNRNWLQSTFYAHSRGSVRRITVYFAILLLFWFGADQIQNEMITVGEFVAFFFYFLLLMFNITFLVTSLTEQQTVMIQASRLYNFYHQDAEVREINNPLCLPNQQGAIEFKEVSFTYQGNAPNVDRVNLKIEVGEHIAVVGESGGGKSTLIKLLGRFYDPQQGEILMNDIPIKNLSLGSLRERLGYVFQEGYLFGTSVKENIRFGNPDSSDEEIVEAAKMSYAHNFIEALPEGYETEVGERGYKLSGGQKQRIAIARMFLKNPSIVVLDEATSALDNESEAFVQKALHVLSQNRTIITVAHRLSTIMEADRIVVMKEGRIIEHGTFEELMQSYGAFYELVNSNKKGSYTDV